ncbi:MAG: hypothetical protein GEU82_19015 [Luteitalea sp.]|nr:hypothetical protein [Luteitalea sp.]
MRTSLALLAVALGVLGAVAPAFAHHSISGEYDPNKKVTFKGTVSKIEWTNPHARIYVDVVDASGVVTTWNLELAARSALVRQGWTGRSVKIGDTVTFEGEPARSGVSGAHARSIILADGRKVFSGSTDQ